MGRSAIGGYGIFARQPIAVGEVIEEAPLLFVPSDAPNLSDYQFAWDTDQNAFALGYGSLYNHSEHNPNAEYYTDKQRHLIVFRATQPIKAGDEIYVNYGKTWFSDRGLRPVSVSSAEKSMSDYIPHLRDLTILAIFLTVIFILSR